MSLNKFISMCGICFTSSICQNQLIYFDVSQNKAHKAHLDSAINILANNPNTAPDVESLISNSLNSLPNEIAAKFLDKLEKILFSYLSLNYKPDFKSGVTNPIGISLLNIS